MSAQKYGMALRKLLLHGGRCSFQSSVQDVASIALALRIALADRRLCKGTVREDLNRVLWQITEAMTTLTPDERAALRGERIEDSDSDG
jgi:hypothetical protein